MASSRGRFCLCLFLLIMVLGFTTQAAAEENADKAIKTMFNDVAASDGNAVFINYVTQRGLINGFPDGTFHPSEGLTRAQAATVMVKAAGLKTGATQSPFKDVGAAHWAASYITAAGQAGFISGFPDGTFHPEEKLTRAQAMSMLMRLCTCETTMQLPLMEDMNNTHWAANAMANALAAGMTGTSTDGKKAYPDAELSRAGLARAVAILLTRDPGLYITPLHGSVTEIKGTVTLTRKGIVSAMTNNGTLAEGDTLRTGAESSARITYPDGSSTLLEANGEIYVKVSSGRSYIKKDGAIGTAVDLLNVDLKKGTLFGALATKHEGSTEGGEQDQALRKTTTLAALPSFRYLAEADKGSPWYKTADNKKVKVKVDMPWGVAAVRGTFIKATVTQDGKCQVSCLTGSAEVQGDSGNNVPLGQGQSSVISGEGQAAGQAAALSSEDKAAFDKVQNWVVQTALNMDVNQELQASKAVVEMTLEIPNTATKDTTVEKVIDALQSTGIKINNQVIEDLQQQIDKLQTNKSLLEELKTENPVNNNTQNTNTSGGGGGSSDSGSSIISLNYKEAGTYGSQNAAEPVTVAGNVTVGVSGVTLQNMVIKGNLTLAEGIGEGDVTLKNVSVKGSTLVYGGGANSIEVIDCSLYTVTVDKANNTVRIVAKGSTAVGTLTLNSGVKLEENALNGTGFSTINTGVDIPADADIVLCGSFDSLAINSPGLNLQVVSGSVGLLTIDSSAEGSSISLAAGVSVAKLTANAQTSVIGAGQIEQAEINAAGVQMEQPPAQWTLADGVSVIIADQTVTTSGANARLAGLILSQGTLSPAFTPDTLTYNASVGSEIDSITLSPTLTDSAAVFAIEAPHLIQAGANPVIGLDPGSNIISIIVTARDGQSTTTYNIVISRPTLQNINITQPATKQSYYVNESMDITGLEITGYYSDGTEKLESISLSDVTGFDSSQPLTVETLTITVGGKSTSYTVEILEVPVNLQEISITQPATKLSYYVNESLEITGLEITGHYSDGNDKIESIGLSNISGFDSSQPTSSQTLTISVCGKTTTYNVEILPAPVTLQSISITNPADKLSYYVNESLDITGLEVTGHYSDGSSQVESINLSNISGFDSSQLVAGQTLTITVGGKTTTYTVEIIEQIISYTVSFKDYDGTELKSQTVNYGAGATAPANPTRVGYSFTGWDKAFANVTSDLTVTAQYSVLSYTVSFKDYDGTELKSQTVNYGAGATAPANPTRIGYSFTGWDKAFANVTSDLMVTAQYMATSISNVSLDTTSSPVGQAQVVNVSISTANASVGAVVTVNLLDSSSNVKASTNDTISANAANLKLTVPATLTAGSYTVQVVVDGASNSPYNAGTYTITNTIAYANFSSNAAKLQVNGNAAILADGTLRLAPASSNKIGSAFYTQKLVQNNKFSTSFAFKLSNYGGSISESNSGTNSSQRLGADGITFVIQSNSNTTTGSNGGDLGYKGINNSVAVEFDTYNNGSSGDYSDSNNNHIAIDFNGSINHSNNALVCTNLKGQGFDLKDANYHYAWIDYDGTTLTIRLSNTSSRADSVQVLSQSINISSYIGSNGAYVGFTAATGGNYQNHDILKWYYNDTYDPIN